MNNPKLLENLASVPSIGSWADAVDRERSKEEASMAPKGEKLRTVTQEEDGTETVTEIITDKDGTRSRVITTFKKVTKKVPRVIAERKKWKKFGAAADDGPGPNVSTTYVTDEVRLQFMDRDCTEPRPTVEEQKKISSKGGHCRICKGNDHWSIQCPYKEAYKINEPDPTDSLQPSQTSTTGGRYVAPSMRDRPAGIGSSTEIYRENRSVRVTNLPTDSPTLEDDLRAMFSRVARIERFYLGRDKPGGKPVGYAFISFESNRDAEIAAQRFNGSRLCHMILKVTLAH